jgi:hypothetical protein
VFARVPRTSASRAQTGTVETSHFSIERRELFVWLACILLVNDILFLAADPPGEAPPLADPLEAIAHTLASKNVFHYLAWYAVFSLLLSADRRRPATIIDAAVALSAATLNALPFHLGTWLPATLVGLYLLAPRPHHAKLAAAATVLLALAFNAYWGPRLFDILAYYILRADAVFVGTLLSLTQPGMGWEGTIVGNPEGHRVFIYSPCSSFHNISLGLLCWVSLTKLVRASWVPADFAVALLVCAAVVALNATRLYLMALGPDHYSYWHGGTGEQLIAWVTTGVVLLISLWGAVRVGKEA